MTYNPNHLYEYWKFNAAARKLSKGVILHRTRARYTFFLNSCPVTSTDNDVVTMLPGLRLLVQQAFGLPASLTVLEKTADSTDLVPWGYVSMPYLTAPPSLASVAILKSVTKTGSTPSAVDNALAQFKKDYDECPAGRVSIVHLRGRDLRVDPGRGIFERSQTARVMRPDLLIECEPNRKWNRSEMKHVVQHTYQVAEYDRAVRSMPRDATFAAGQAYAYDPVSLASVLHLLDAHDGQDYHGPHACPPLPYAPITCHDYDSPVDLRRKRDRAMRCATLRHQEQYRYRGLFADDEQHVHPIAKAYALSVGCDRRLRYAHGPHNTRTPQQKLQNARLPEWLQVQDVHDLVTSKKKYLDLT